MARTPSRIVLIATAAALALLAGCGTSAGDDALDETTTTAATATTAAPTKDGTETTEVETTEVDDTEPSGDDDLCAALQVLSQYDIDSAEIINSGDWEATQAFFVDRTADVLTAYDDAIALDTELSADLEAMRAITEGTADMAADSDDLAELSDKLLSQPGLMEAGEAGIRVNEYAQEHCGFSTGGN